MYKQYIRRSSRLMFSLQQKSTKYEWARKYYQEVTDNREIFTNSIFAKLVALDPAKYYEKMYKDKVDTQLSSLIVNL